MDFSHSQANAVDNGTAHEAEDDPRSWTFWNASPGSGSRVIDGVDQERIPMRHGATTAETRALLKRVLEPDHHERCTRWAIREDSKFRQMWNLIMFPALLYVGTLLPYKLCFMEFHVVSEVEAGTTWQVCEIIMEVVFVFDLLFPFLFTYRDAIEYEVASLPKIACNYLRTSFFINLIACFPPVLIEIFVQEVSGVEGDSGANLHKGVRFFKIQRTARILRLVRIIRVFKILEESSRWRWFKHLRPVRIVSFVLKLFWVVHLAACGWYLVAALHEPVDASWPFRVFDAVTNRIADAGPLRSWMVSYYFCLTVFTTVGFGDISPETSGELVYACMIMCAGSVVNGMVMSEIISILTKSGRLQTQLAEQEKLVKDFSRQAQLKGEAENWLRQWIATRRAVSHSADKDKMMKLLMGSSFPRAILGKLPSELFHGRLIKNRFITIIKHTHQQKDWPIQLPLFVGISGCLRRYDMGEVVYYASDHPWNVFLILTGIFSHVASRKEKIKTLSSRSMERSSPSGNFAAEQAYLYPCCIYGFGNYFGDEEIILRRRHRRSTVRCESPDGGELVVLQKNDFLRMTREFPDMAHMWLQNAFRRERFREKCVKRMSSGALDYTDYTELAALRIQAAIREFIHRCRMQHCHTLKRRGSAKDGMGALADDVSMALPSPSTRTCSRLSRSQEVSADKFALLSEEVADLKSSMMILLDGQRKLQATVQALSGGGATRRHAPEFWKGSPGESTEITI